MRELREERVTVLEENEQLKGLNKKLVNRLEEIEHDELTAPRGTNWPIEFDERVE